MEQYLTPSLSPDLLLYSPKRGSRGKSLRDHQLSLLPFGIYTYKVMRVFMWHGVWVWAVVDWMILLPLESRVIGLIPAVRENTANGDRTQSNGEQAQWDVDGHYQPEGKHVQRLVAVLALARIVIRLVLLEDPEASDDEPPEHEAVDQLLCWGLPQSLSRLILSAAHASW